MTFSEVLASYRVNAVSNQHLGERFERLMQAYLKTDPQYAPRFRSVWMWEEFPFRQEFGGSDIGIDIVCLTHEGEYWAVQCKCYQESTVIDKSTVDSFLATSAKSFKNEKGEEQRFGYRLWISTSSNWGKNAEEVLKGQSPGISRITHYDLEHAPVDWEKLQAGITGDLARTEKKSPRTHQQEAISRTIEGLKEADRGKLIMACGTGKTLTSLWIAEEQTKHSGFVLFLVPSIALLGQTLREWTSDSSHPIRPICVCSDSRITKNYEKDDDLDQFKVYDLALPASTDVGVIAEQMRSELNKKEQGLVVVFSTYQSLPVIMRAQDEVLDGEFGKFDLIICDEAHRTTGITMKDDDDSSFTAIHDPELIKAQKRVYMTATPRLYDERSQERAEEDGATPYSMDNVEQYGDEFYRIGFGEAVDRGLLTDYKVIILTLNENDIPAGIQHMIANREEEISTDDASKLIGCVNALSKRVIGDDGAVRTTDPEPMRKAVAFCPKIVASERITSIFNDAGEVYYDELDEEGQKGMVRVAARHIDGSMNAPTREELMSWLRSTSAESDECRVLSNVRCLSEGVDVPSLDAVMFLSPRNSQVDVVQSVGRVMRLAPGKRYGYIIIPVLIPSDVKPERALEDNERFKVVWTVLNALRAHDDRFDAIVNKIDLNKNRPPNIVIGQPGADDSDMPRKGQLGSDKTDKQLTLHFEELQNAIYARLVLKVGNKRYWDQWAKSVGEIAERQVVRIRTLVQQEGDHSEAFSRFMDGLHRNINPSISEEEAIEMLSQHIITRPVFEALFDDYAFADKNPVSLSMQNMLDALEDQALEKDTEALKKFYDSVRRRAEGIDNAEGKQRIIIELYDKFFKTAFPRLVEKLGIVYTPVEVVDYIIHSVDDLLRSEFNTSLSEEDVHVIDPFTGTGTFITRMIQNGLIKPEDLERKFKHELHANEIVLLAYYIAAINIEAAFHDFLGADQPYVPFDGICMTDTFQLAENDGGAELYSEMFPQNSDRVDQQKKTPIHVVVANPPYSVGQGSANDDAQNQSYPRLEARLAETYVAESSATQLKSIYDSYIKAFRWASDRIDSSRGGVIGFVTNGSWIDGNAHDGFRKCLVDEFDAIHVFNLRGNARTQGEQRRKEKDNVFGGGTRTPVCISLLVRNPKRTRKQAHIFYRDIGDYLSREEKLQIISNRASVSNPDMNWQYILPNTSGDWINHRTEGFSKLIPLGFKGEGLSETVFKPVYSSGVVTNRDAWCYNSSLLKLRSNMNKTARFYKQQMEKLQRALRSDPEASIDNVIEKDSASINWTRSVLRAAKNGTDIPLLNNSWRVGLYRPYFKQNVYFDRKWNENVYRMPSLFPDKDSKNLLIIVTGTGGNKPFSCLMTDCLPDLQLLSNGQCFPLHYWAESSIEGSLFESNPVQSSFTNWFVEKVRSKHGSNISRRQIFDFIYGLFHSPHYRKKFEADLKKQLARVTLDVTTDQFMDLSIAGSRLAELHVNYETVPPHPEVEIRETGKRNLQVGKMRYGRKGDRSIIMINESLSIVGIPEIAYDYHVNGKSAIEWLMDRYRVSTHKGSGITNDPNDWAAESGNPTFILDLLLSVIHVSTQTVDIVNSLPEIDFGG